MDTHLFRELGELLVGRDSTALIELIKNSYDADATDVIVYGENLSDPKRGIIRIADNGTGMSASEFTQGFLRIASRTKDVGERRSGNLGRRFTGAKGIGRLAVHKLARVVEIHSRRWDSHVRHNGVLQASSGIEATIQWDVVESQLTLDKLEGTDAITVKNVNLTRAVAAGTTITLRNLRQAWTRSALARFLEETQTFEVPRSLVTPIPSGIASPELLIQKNCHSRLRKYQARINLQCPA